MSNPSNTLSMAGLETVYDLLATAIDRAGPDKAALFLAKLTLLNANALGNADTFQQHVEAALEDLSPPGAAGPIS